MIEKEQDVKWGKNKQDKYGYDSAATKDKQYKCINPCRANFIQ